MSQSSVLFLCTANSARSQMAEGLLRHRAGDRFRVYSAGLEPTSVHPLAIRAMAEIGINIDEQRSKSLSEFLGTTKIDHVVIVCDRAEQSCPKVWPFALTRSSWPFDDPAAAEGSEEQQLARFREIRDEIDERIEEWLAEFSPGEADE